MRIAFHTICLILCLFVANSLCFAESASDWYLATKSREDELEHSLRFLRAETLEPVGPNEKIRIQLSLTHIKQNLVALHEELATLKNKKFKEGAPEEWMGLIQLIQDLQLSNELDSRDLRKIIAND